MSHCFALPRRAFRRFPSFFLRSLNRRLEIPSLWSPSWSLSGIGFPRNVASWSVEPSRIVSIRGMRLFVLVPADPTSSSLSPLSLLELLELESSDIPTVWRIRWVRPCLTAFLTLLAFSALNRLTIAICERPSWNLSRIPNSGSLFRTKSSLLRVIWRRGIASVLRDKSTSTSRFGR